MRVSQSLCFQRPSWEKHFYRHQTSLSAPPTFHPRTAVECRGRPLPPELVRGETRTARGGRWAGPLKHTLPPWPCGHLFFALEAPGPCAHQPSCLLGCPSYITDLRVFMT